MVVNEYVDMESPVVSGITHHKNDARITLRKVPDTPGIAAKIFSPIAQAGIIVDMIIQNTDSQGLTDLTFTIPRVDLKAALEIERQVARTILAEDVLADDTIAKVSITGVGMRSHSGVAAKMFEALAAENINIMMITTSEIKTSCIIEEKYTELAVRVLHKVFGLENGEIEEEQ